MVNDDDDEWLSVAGRFVSDTKMVNGKKVHIASMTGEVYGAEISDRASYKNDVIVSDNKDLLIRVKDGSVVNELRDKFYKS